MGCCREEAARLLLMQRNENHAVLDTAPWKHNANDSENLEKFRGRCFIVVFNLAFRHEDGILHLNLALVEISQTWRGGGQG
jgi:hypothetical protein